MMMVSTRSTVTATVAAHDKASRLATMWSKIPFFCTSIVPGSSMLTPCSTFPAACAAYRSDTVDVVSCPAFSASVWGMISSVSAYFLMAYCSSPGVFSARSLTKAASRSSVHPAPGTMRGSLVSCLKLLTPFSTARWRSSSDDEVEERSTMVAMRVCSCDSRLKVQHLIPPISSTLTASAAPISSGRGAPKRAREVAPVSLQRRASSNLEGHLTTMMLLRSRKCIAISEMVVCATSTLTPVSAISLTILPIDSSSLLL
mmetsp:Transcript_33244/g.83909  ORF Transcript_33244/g.83909 Transcript_33244/m.83909 type:complete len:258 (+) Transcript_33244:134-907(+)